MYGWKSAQVGEVTYHLIAERGVCGIRRALARATVSPGIEVGKFVHDPSPKFSKAWAPAQRAELL